MKYKAIKLITQVLTSNNTKLEIDFRATYTFLKFHHLEIFLYYAYKLGIIEVSDNDLVKLKKEYNINLYKTSTQEEELKLIKNNLKENDIMYLPLKGSVIRGIYPSIDLRTMADIDILVKQEDLKRVSDIMKSLGYKNTSHGGNHDVYIKMPFMNVEIHKAMIDESYEMSSYYNDIWEKVNYDLDDPYLSHEDVYIYIVSHAAKHYLSGGTGIRSVLDVYLFNQKHELDFDYIDLEFKKLNISNFANNIKDLGYVWFRGDEPTDSLIKMEEYIFRSGVYGITTHQLAKEFNGNSDSKFKVAIKKAFPSFKNMKKMFPSLKYLFVFLPFYYLYRGIRGLVRGNVQTSMKTLKNISKSDIENKKEIVKDMKDEDELI